MRPVFFSVLALFAVALAHADGSVTGKYRNRSVAGRANDVSELSLRVNGRFLLERDGKVFHGDYRVEDGELTLRTEDGDRIRGEIRDGRVTLEGQSFDRVSGGGFGSNARRFPTDASSGRLRRGESRSTTDDRDERPDTQSGGFGAPFSKAPLPPTPAPDLVPVPAVVAPAPKVVALAPAPRVEPARPRLREDDLAGLWTVRRDGFEEKGWRLELRKNGDFRFAMKGATSEGTWTVVDNEIVLVYKTVDGEPLEEGASGVKRIPCSFDGTAFQIDTFRYERASDK